MVVFISFLIIFYFLEGDFSSIIEKMNVNIVYRVSPKISSRIFFQDARDKSPTPNKSLKDRFCSYTTDVLNYKEMI